MGIFNPITYRSLRSQILLVVVALLLIPVLVMLYDIFLASKSDEIMLLEREERLGSIVQNQVVPALNASLEGKLNSDKITSLDPETQSRYLRESFDECVKPLVPNFPGVRFGLYLPEGQQIFTHGFLREYRQLSPEESLQREKRILTEADPGLIAVAASQRPLARLASSLGEQTFEYLAPVPRQGKLLAVVWADERLHPIFAYSQNFRLLIRYLTLCVFLAGAAGALIVVHNLASGVSLIKKGLGKMEKDLNELLPGLPGEAGQIARAINRMAVSLLEKEKLEEELRRSERLASLGRLVTGVAHELRNPISVVRTTVQLMETEFKDTPAIDEYTSVIKEQVDRQNRIIQELLDFGRPGKNLVQPVSINSLLEKILTFTTPLLQQNNIRLVKETNEHLPLIEADGERIKQVFVNLILNAVAAMPEGGILTIKGDRDEHNLYVEFTDTGCGIAPTDLPNIFDPFYTTWEGGTGLGLSISHQIIKSHGGIIEAANTDPHGATFRVTLPLLQQTATGRSKDGA